jgi:hypothetical protein
LESHASTVASLLDQAGIVSCEAPAQLREIAGWAAYRSRDLRRRIDKILVADSGASGTRAPGFRFAGRGNARKAGAEEADKIRGLLDGHHPKKLAAELAKAKPYLADPDYAAAFFKALGPKETFNLLSATRGHDLAVVGRALASAQQTQKLPQRFFDGIIDAARRQAAALDAYTHGGGGISARDRQRYAVEEYVQRAGAPPGTYAALETIAPLTPLLEAGAKVAVIGGAVAIVSLGAAAIATPATAWVAPALGEQVFVAFAESGVPVVVDLQVPASEFFGGLAEELSVVERHLAANPDAWQYLPNQAMLERIRIANATGRALTIAEENFLRHELVESELMQAGFSEYAAHMFAGLTHPTFANYDPEVIQAYPEWFNDRWKGYWGIE